MLDMNMNITMHCKKRLALFSRPRLGCHLPNSPWPGIIKLFPARESSVSDIPAGYGEIGNLFLPCEVCGSFNKANFCLYLSEELDKRVKFEIILISPQMLGKMQGAKAEVRQEITMKVN
jgi:hypothetical protein